MAQPVFDNFGRNNSISREPVLAGAGYSNIPGNKNFLSNNYINNPEYDSYSESRAASQDGMRFDYRSDSYRAGRPNVMFSGYAGASGNTYANSGFTGYASGAVSGNASQRKTTGGYTSAPISGKAAEKGKSVRTPDISMGRKTVAPSVSLGDLSAERERAEAASVQRKKSAVKNRKAVRTVKTTSERPFPLTFIIMIAMSTLLLMYIIYNLVSLNEMTIKLADSQSMLTELVKEEKELSLKLELKNDLLEIEKIATEEYGMVKNDKVVKQYINIEGEDKIEVNIPQNEVADSTVSAEIGSEDNSGAFTNVMSAFAKRFESLLEAIN